MAKIDAWIAQRQYEAQGGNGPPPPDPRSVQQAALGHGLPRSQPTMQPAAAQTLWTGVVTCDIGGRIQLAGVLTSLPQQPSPSAPFSEAKLPQQLVIRHIVHLDKIELGRHIRATSTPLAKLDPIPPAQLERMHPVLHAQNPANAQALRDRLAPDSAIGIIPVEPGSGQCIALLANAGSIFAAGFLGSHATPPVVLDAIARSQQPQ